MINDNSIINGDVFDSANGYSTCDLYLASFFLSAGTRMIKTDRDPKTRRVYFIFEKSPLLQELKVNYFSRQAKVDALTFADNIKSLKSLCHNITTTTPIRA
jgi:Domain of unknown function (DUF5659)